LLRSGGLQVVTLPFELHPEIPPGGHERSRSVGRWSVIAEECAAAGLPWDPQPRSPNTRRVLELSEWVRRVAGAEVHVEFEALVFRAHFAEQRPIDDAGVQAELLAGVGVDAADGLAAVSSGEPATWVDESMALARDVGVGGTPAWLFLGQAGQDKAGDGFFVPGVHPRPFYQRLAARFASA
jgi:predicted DsbA family dithiol-disulfide isomerase